VSRRAQVAAMVMGLAVLAFCVAGVVGVATASESPGESPVAHQVAFELGFTLAFGVLGGFLVAKRPGNALGWIFFAQGLGASTLFAANRLDITGTGGVWLALLSLWGLAAALGLLPLTLLLFPDGRLASRRWRPLGWAGAVGVAGFALTHTVMPFEQAGVGGPHENPLALPALAGFLEALFLVAALLLLVALLGGTASLVVRFRRARGVERAQVKWVALAALWGVIIYATGDLTTTLPWISWDLVLAAAILPFPVAIGVAVSRYRLYEVDRVISRTVSYAILTAGLVGLYAGGVVLLTPVLAGVGGGSELAVAASTLAVAAAFGPLRRRVQTAVDRHFNRTRYDARQQVQAFSEQLRDAVDIEQLSAQLLAVVARTVEPASSSLWLRAPEEAPGVAPEDADLRVPTRSGAGRP
jgi:hypothetical protein